MSIFSQELVWWITIFDLPAMAGLLGLIWRTRIACDKAVDGLQITLDRRAAQLREALHAFKLEAAKNYAAHRDLHALETRLVGHLLRIEAKLDKTALKTAALKAGGGPAPR